MLRTVKIYGLDTNRRPLEINMRKRLKAKIVILHTILLGVGGCI